MSKWLLIVVAAVGAAWYGHTKLQDRKIARAEAALARVACETGLFDEVTALVERTGAGASRAAFDAEREALLLKFDEAAVLNGAKVGDTKALSGSGVSVATRRAVRFDTRVHEACPDRYNEKKEKLPIAIGVVFGLYATR